ncbi:MAG: deoxyguanosinetriphosphate triphosphohydrolase [Clostridiales bacterium]|nr:deoxyguanosinetriphosphate triphosphohydrolase [Clostridiales bacterium]
MDIRIITEERELNQLSAMAAKSRFSLGRVCPEEECPVRTCFQRDRDRVIHSKAFRRLMYKTQAFIYPEGDHFRTRLTHTLEVSQIARTISRALQLNEDLTEAIALGHDLGHTPFGHIGEHDLNRVVLGGFRHNEQSVRIVERLKKNGRGLNLTAEVRDGILNHRGAGKPMTAEGKVVQLSDKIAYVNHDIDDALRTGKLKEEDLPKDCTALLGHKVTARIDFLVKDVIKTSLEEGKIKMSSAAKEALYELRGFMFKNIYTNPEVVSEHKSFETYLSRIYFYYDENFGSFPQDYLHIYGENELKERIICDYIAGMTDRFVVKLYEKLRL